MSGRAVWTGAITLGIASVPVKAYIAARSEDLPLHMLHAHDEGAPSRVKYRLMCESEDVAIERGDTVRGYAVADDQLVVLTEDELAGLRGASDVLAISSFAPASEVPAVYLEESYSLNAQEAGRRGLALLLRLLTDRGLVAVGKLTMHGRERVCVLRPLDGLLLMHTLHYPDAVRVEVGTPMPAVELSEAELTMGGSLVDMLLRPFDLHEYSDCYRAALVQLVEAKVEGKAIETAAAAPAAAPPMDLMEALRASVAAHQKPAKTAAKGSGRKRKAA